MKIFEVNWKKIEFDIGEELTVKDLRKIAPYMTDMKSWQEIETIIQIGTRLSTNQEESEKVLESLTMSEFEEFATFISWLIDVKKKMTK